MKSKTDHDIFFEIYKIYLEKIIDKYGVEYGDQFSYKAIEYAKKTYDEYWANAPFNNISDR